MNPTKQVPCMCCGGAESEYVCPECADELDLIGFELGLDELLRTDALLHDAGPICPYCARSILPHEHSVTLQSGTFHKSCELEFGLWIAEDDAIAENYTMSHRGFGLRVGLE